ATGLSEPRAEQPSQRAGVGPARDGDSGVLRRAARGGPFPGFGAGRARAGESVPALSARGGGDRDGALCLPCAHAKLWGGFILRAAARGVVFRRRAGGCLARGGSLDHEVRILLVDDHAMFREGLAESLAKDPGLKVVGQCSNTAEGLALLKTADATMVLLDVDLGAGRGLAFVEGARQRGFAGQILVVTAGVSDQEAVQLIQAGVAGIIHKQHSSAELRDAIRRVASGERWLENEYLTPLFRSVDRSILSSRPKLTERDLAVLRAIFQGLSNKDIAARLTISEGAVKSSIQVLFEKLGARTRAQLVRVALEQYREHL